MFTSPIPRRGRVHRSETSRLISPREPGGPGGDWKADNQLSQTLDQINNSHGALAQKVAKLGKGMPVSSMHPFKIYQFPTQYRTVHSSNDWKRFTVRGGLMGFFSVLGTDLSAGTNNPYGMWGSADYDNVIQYPFFDPTGAVKGQQFFQFQFVPGSGSTLAQPGWTEVVVPADGNQYYFWVSLCSALIPVVMFGATPVGATILYGGTQKGIWPGFPEPDPYHWLIGSIFYNGSSYTVNQFLNEHIQAYPFQTIDSVPSNPACAPTRSCGTYAAGQFYFYGDIVTQVKPSNSKNVLSQYCFTPDSNLAFIYRINQGPIVGVDPAT